MRTLVACGLLAMCAACAQSQGVSSIPQGALEVDRDQYADQIQGFWVAQAIANWTGLRTEGRRSVPPFYTDADWPTTFDGRQLFFVTDQDPWLADDDTDIEYVYAHLMNLHGSSELGASQIQQGWIDHINRFIWVSNARARELMDRGLVPPETSLPSANLYSLRIDAQLTTEIFGIVSPGMPARALELADLPITTTARGHAAHASQYFVVLHALGAVRGTAALTPSGIESLVTDARQYIPDTSKAADIVDTVLADYQTNPDKANWERTRDLVAQRYQLEDDLNGFRYIQWTESSVNFASAIVCLLYGQGDLKETIRIGTLTGWDSDNPTATMGGLLGLMLGIDGVRAAFPSINLSDRYWILRTRDLLPDYLPDDPEAEDTFAMLARRMLGAVDDSVQSQGGVVNALGWLIPPQLAPDIEQDNPLVALGQRSANNMVRASGGTVTASTSLTSTPVNGAGYPVPDRFTNGNEHDPSGIDVLSVLIEKYFWTRGAAPDANGRVTLQISYSQPIELSMIRFIEGDHFVDGGWFETLSFEARVNNLWVPLNVTSSSVLDSNRPFQIMDFALASPIIADGIRASGVVGGSAQFVTVSEFDAFAPADARRFISWDINQDGRADVEDLYVLNDAQTDLNNDGVFDDNDKMLLEHAVRWRELELLNP